MEKKYLITGATGFLGSHLLRFNHVNSLIPVKDICLLTSKNIVGYKNILHKNYTFVKQDFDIFPNIDVLIHLSSFSPKNRSDANNILENLKTVNRLVYLLENLKNIPKKIVYISTISVYGAQLINSPYLISEKSNTNPDFLYGHAKLFSEEILKEFCLKNNVKLYILRIGVSYGANDNLRQGTIPTIVKSILKEKEIIVYNNGTDLKHFIHTDDISRMILQAACQSETDMFCNVINLVDSRAFSVMEIIKLAEKFCDKSVKIIYKERMQGNDSLFDNTLMLDFFGNLKISFETGLKGVCQYYKNNLK